MLRSAPFTNETFPISFVAVMFVTNTPSTIAKEKSQHYSQRSELICNLFCGDELDDIQHYLIGSHSRQSISQHQQFHAKGGGRRAFNITQ